MNAYVASVIDYVKNTHGNEPEFVQTVEEVLSSISPIMDAHPEYEKVDLLKRMVEPERMFTFRVCWMDDKGEYHTNRPVQRRKHCWLQEGRTGYAQAYILSYLSGRTQSLLNRISQRSHFTSERYIRWILKYAALSQAAFYTA